MEGGNNSVGGALKTMLKIPWGRFQLGRFDEFYFCSRAARIVKFLERFKKNTIKQAEIIWGCKTVVFLNTRREPGKNDLSCGAHLRSTVFGVALRFTIS